MSKKAPIPTKDDLKKLPRLAIVAFTARCARRVLPFYEASKLPSEEDRKAIREAIDLSESVARGDDIPTAKAANAADVACVAADAADAARAFSAGHAARTAANAARTASHGDQDACATRAATAAITANASFSGHSGYAFPSPPQIPLYIWQDYNVLLAASKEHGWTDRTGVTPEFFGPLWPDGEPEGWPPTDTRKDNDATK